MKISLVIPSFNHEEFLEATLKSILSQDCGEGVELETILMDGGSKDGSVEIIKRYADKLTFWISEKDKGQTDALVKGFARTTGDIMGWVNSDDLLTPGSLAAVARFFREHPEVDVLYGDTEVIDREGRFVKIQKEIDFDLPILLWVYDYIPQTSTFWRRSIWEKSEGFDPAIDCAMDYDLWLRFLKAGAKFAHIPESLSQIRRYPEQKNQRLRDVSDREDLACVSRFLGRKPSTIERRTKYYWHKARRIAKRLAMGAYG